MPGALADGFAEGLVGGEGGEPCGLRVDLGSQDVKLTQNCTRRAYVGTLSRPCIQLIADAFRMNVLLRRSALELSNQSRSHSTLKNAPAVTADLTLQS